MEREKRGDTEEERVDIEESQLVGVDPKMCLCTDT